MGITADTYFEKDEYMTVSQFKRFEKCQVSAISDTPYPKSTALLVGSYIDAYVEGTLDKFVEENPELFSSRGATKGELKSDYKNANEICSFIDSNERIQKFLSGEKQAIFTGEISGVPFKVKLDSYSKGIAIADLKVMRSITDSTGAFYDFITPWGYDVQLAVYQEITFQATGERLPVYIVAVTKESPINSVIVQIPQDILDKALYRVESQVGLFNEVKHGEQEAIGCGVCATCISKRTMTPLISMSDLLL